MKLEFVEKKAEEVAGGQAESTLKVRDEDDVLTRLQNRRDFGTRKPAFHAFRDAPGPDQPVKLASGHVGPLPGGSGGYLHLSFLDQIDDVVFRHLGGGVEKKLQKIDRRR